MQADRANHTGRYRRERLRYLAERAEPSAPGWRSSEAEALGDTGDAGDSAAARCTPAHAAFAPPRTLPLGAAQRQGVRLAFLPDNIVSRQRPSQMETSFATRYM